MKGLDTPILLGLLDGSRTVKDLIRSLSGEELATTELNLLELTAIAVQGTSRGRKDRLEALERLRRRLTVLPIDKHVTEGVAGRPGPFRTGSDLLSESIYAAFEAAGCSHVITDSKPASKAPRKLKVTVITVK